ncbi:MAG: class I SAM-dependent methyltransferase [Myxococcota bacterium]
MSAQTESHDRSEHRDFLNQYYGWSRHIYDLTRKYYLIGREYALAELLDEPWERLIEIGPGTGRNLRKLRRKRPNALLGGVEASDQMLSHARERCPWATLIHGFAEDADYTELLGGRPDRVLFSYCLSMVQDPVAALTNARDALAPGGEVLVVDFGDLNGIRQPVRGALQRFLNHWHVRPLDTELLKQFDADLSDGLGAYYCIARIRT